MRKHYHSIDEEILRNGEMEFNSLLKQLRDKNEREFHQLIVSYKTKLTWKETIASHCPNGNELYHNAERYYS